MTTDYHDPHGFGAPLTSAELNAPLGQLDAALATVIATGSGASTSLTSSASSGQATLVVASSVGFAVGDPIYIGTGTVFESRIIATVPDATHITVTVNLTSTYASGKPVSKSPVEIVDARGAYSTLGGRLGALQVATLLDITDDAFGASTASADNVVALQAVLDYQKANGGRIYIPEGTFLSSPLTYTTTATQALHILGAGRDRSILKPVAGTGTVLTLSGPMSSSTFRDFAVDGTGGTAHGLYYSSTAGPDWLYQSTFENLSFINCAQKGLYVKSSFANRYVNIYAGGNGQDQIKVWGGVGDYYERIDIGTTVAPVAVTLQTSAAADDIILATAHGFAAGDIVRFPTLTGGTGLTIGKAYWVIAANLAANTFQVSATPGGAAVNFTTDITAGTVRAVGYAGIRAIDGGTFVGCNGIYTVGTAAGPLFKFGGDGTAESDSRTRYPSVHLIGGNVESFSTTGILFVLSLANVVRLDRVSFLTAASAANCKAVEMLQSNTQVGLALSGCSFALGSGASWANGYEIHTTAPVFSDGAATGIAPLAAYSPDYSIAYPITQREFGTSSGNTSTYNWKPNILRGYTDVEYMAAMTLGSVYDGNDHVQRTAAATMPASGTYRRGDIVDNCSHAIAEAGGAGVKYTLTGWRRLTDGSAHVLNTDWVERRELTGN